MNLDHIRLHTVPSLLMRDVNMPQGGFNNVDGADVANLDLVLLAEPLPIQTPNIVAAILVGDSTHLPRPGAAH